jgi:hypothetical protein
VEGRNWDVLVIGRAGETRAFHFAASKDVAGDLAKLVAEALDPAAHANNPAARLVWEHSDHGSVWGERMGSGCMPEQAALRIAEMLNQTVEEG